MKEKAQSFEELKPMLRPTGVEHGVIKVDIEKCNSCGLCILNCPFKCMEMDEDKHPKMKNQYVCVSCFNCMAACPTDALSAERNINIKGGFFDTQTPPIKMPLPPKDAEGKLSEWNTVERLVLERRSVRHYKKDPVPEPLIARVLEAGRFAPSGGNHQPWKFAVVTDPELIEEMETVCQAYWAGVFPVFNNDETIINMVGEVETGVFHPITQHGIRSVAQRVLPVFMGAPAIIFLGAHPKLNNPAICIGICGQNMNIVANSLGLGVCWSNFGSGAVNAIPELKSKLGFEEPWTIHTSLVLGYPKFKQSGMVARHYRPITWFRPGIKKTKIQK
ncbi:MAG: nitroreductase family protein [Deltaproteobacteria bacterium]|nr:nitroreductase family protein [Deltaproteobacteria bacterium]